jgi:hypothetical protein
VETLYSLLTQLNVNGVKLGRFTFHVQKTYQLSITYTFIISPPFYSRVYDAASFLTAAGGNLGLFQQHFTISIFDVKSD